MKIRILFFGILKDLADREVDSIDLPPTATLSDLLAHYAANVPKLREHFPAIAMSINQEFAHPTDILHDGDEVALLPPVSGGSDARAQHCSITHDPIDTAAVANALKKPEDGATTIFEGIVRNNTRGRQTLYLDYESYEAMALKTMEELAAKVLADFKIRDVALVHRLGRIEIGETSVLIVVASAHRGAAFDACRWLIDTLKRTVPIWKKEYFIDGAVWADGEPFPADISTGETSVTSLQATPEPDKASH